MRTVKPSVQGWKTTAARLAVLLIIVQALALRVGWSQELAPPKLDEEFSKQKKI